MSACEKCWSDAHSCIGNVPEEYARLIEDRTGDKECTPEEKAGPDAAPCPLCAGRKVLHQYTGECMANQAHTPYDKKNRCYTNPWEGKAND